MTIILKRSAFRNDRDDATIIVEQYTEPGMRVFLWRTLLWEDRLPHAVTISDHLFHKPSRKSLKSRL